MAVTFADTPTVETKRVYYEGSDTLQEGYALCYNFNYGTASAADTARLMRVEKPATANLEYFAGVVHPDSAGKTGPCYVTIIVPSVQGEAANVHTDQNCTLGTTELAAQDGSYALGAAGAGAPAVAKALQTVDRSVTNGLVFARLGAWTAIFNNTA